MDAAKIPVNAMMIGSIRQFFSSWNDPKPQDQHSTCKCNDPIELRMSNIAADLAEKLS